MRTAFSLNLHTPFSRICACARGGIRTKPRPSLQTDPMDCKLHLPYLIPCYSSIHIGERLANPRKALTYA